MPSDTVNLVEFLNSVPPTLTVSLLHLAPWISIVRSSLQILTWSGSSWRTSWLAVAAWWTTCLFLDTTLRRFLPLIIFGLVALWRWRRTSLSSESVPMTETEIQTVVTDLTIIQSSLPNHAPAPPSLEISKAFRAAVILSVPYFLFSFVVSFRVVIAIAGTVILTWRAPWAVVTRAAVWRSAWFRWGVYKCWAFLIGQPLPPPVLSPQQVEPSTEDVKSIRFLFKIYENQRWWMGLDWTAALLPAERPSWCSAALQAMSPPSSFKLPESATAYLSDGKGGKLKRKVIWQWEEPEWKILIHRENHAVSRVERPLPNIKDDIQNQSLLSKAAGHLRPSGQTDSQKASVQDDHSSDDADQPEDEVLTDSEGWVFADNKWENQSNKGGIGKYTRYRRWTRIARVFEIVEPATKDDIVEEKAEAASPLDASVRSLEPVIIQDVPDSSLKRRLKNTSKSAE